MKTFPKQLLLLAFLLAGTFIPDLAGDPPPDPPPLPGEGHGGANNQTPAGAPIDDGMDILFILGTTFAMVTLFKKRKRLTEPT